MRENSKLCCQNLRAPGSPSPFDKVVSLGYYDGTTHGLARCRSCATCYSYALQAWDGDQETRVYSMGQVPPRDFENLVSELSLEQEQTWPLWVPNFANPSHRTKTILALAKNLLQSHDPQFVIAAVSPERKILAIKRLTSSSKMHLTSRNYPRPEDWVFWRGFLEIEEKASPSLTS